MVSTEESASPSRAPDCLVCAYFRVTWDPDFPRACDVFGIKTRQLPSLEVFAATGRHCPAFERKLPVDRTRPPAPGGSGSDDDGGLWA